MSDTSAQVAVPFALLQGIVASAAQEGQGDWNTSFLDYFDQIDRSQSAKASPVKLPPSSDWAPIGNGVECLSPPPLRTTSTSHEECNSSRYLARVLTLRYMATRLAMHWAKQQETNTCAEILDAERSLVETAKAQRCVISQLYENTDYITDNTTTLAVKSQDEAPGDGYLVTVNKIRDSSPAGQNILSRARTVLFNAKKWRANHNILMFDNLENFAQHEMHESKHKVFDSNIHVIGSPEKIRYISIVSDLINANERFDPLEEELNEGRFRLDKRLLKDAFLGQTSLRVVAASRVSSDDSARKKASDPKVSYLGEKGRTKADHETLINSALCVKIFLGKRFELK